MRVACIIVMVIVTHFLFLPQKSTALDKTNRELRDKTTEDWSVGEKR